MTYRYIGYLPLAVVVGGLVLLVGCGGDDSMASQSARAFREAQQRGETFEGDGHTHGHGAMAPPSESAIPDDGQGEEMHPETAGPAKDHAAMGHDGGSPAPRAGQPMDHAAMGHAEMDHSAMGHGAPAAPAGRPADPHAGHRAPATEAPGQPTALPDRPEHAGHAMSTSAPLAEEPQALTAVPGQPAATLSADPLDAPAATSVAEARRAATLAAEMSGAGHGGHGGTYRHLDAGREPEEQAAPEPSPDAHQGHEPPDEPPAEG